MELNTIQNKSNWGKATESINTNFAHVGSEIDKLKYAAYNSKLYPSLEVLQQEKPNPSVGDWAIVGDTIPGAIYRCSTEGVWSATGETGGGYGMNVTETNVTENNHYGDIINNPDDEDLTEETNENEEKVIKLADKEYNAAGFSGLGRLYLRMAISASKNVLTQDMMSKANTRYIIQYDYDLNGTTINVPEGCVLDFQGGSISNGILNGNLTKISSYPTQIFNDITISGSWIINNAYSEWFGAKGDNSTDDTEAIQKCLDSFYKCKLLSKTYAVTSIKLPNNSMLEGFDLGREKMATIRQIDSYSGDLITTGNTSYSGVVLKYFRITGGQQDNFAITITVPQSYIYKVTTDLYHGSGIHLSERAWITVIDSCSLFGNINDAATRSTISYAIKIDSAGGLVKVLNCNINYYIVGVAIFRGDQVTVCNTNISECSQNQFPKLPLYAVWVINGKSVDIFDNYIENFNTGIRIEGGTKINIHDNFINGLQAAPFGIDITGEINGLNIQDNYIYTGYTGAKCIRAISVTGENTIRIVRNNLDETKLYGCKNFYFETYSNITDFRKVVGYPITIRKISDIYESISGNVYNIPSNVSRIMYSIEDRSSYSDIGTTLTYKLPVSTTVKEGSIIIFDKGKEDKYFQTTIDAGNEIITGMDQPGNRSQILSMTGMTGTIALIAKYGYWQVLWCTGTWIYKNGFKSSSENYRPTENLKKGDLFFNETSNKIQVYNGTSWYTLATE